MAKKTRKSEDIAPEILQEPTVTYRRMKSFEEKKNRIEQSVKDAEAGLGVTEEVMFNRHPEWL